MRFSEAYAALEQGRPIARANSLYKSIKKIDPSQEPGVDGPERVFVVKDMDRGYLTSFGEFEKEEDAKAALKAERTKLTKEWSAYEKLQTAFNAASPEEKEALKLDPGIQPMYRKSYFDNVTIEERSASRINRLSAPYLIGRTKGGSVEPVSLSGADLFASDWSIA